MLYASRLNTHSTEVVGLVLDTLSRGSQTNTEDGDEDDGDDHGGMRALLAQPSRRTLRTF